MDRSPIVEKCYGCGKTVTQTVMLTGEVEVLFCGTYAMPETKWRIGNCPMATHLQKEIKKQGFVDPLKANKKSMQRKK
jgi:hypothetical protein